MSCIQFISKSLALRTAFHNLHLASKSEPRHRALGDFYEGLVDLVDAYAEVYMGLNGRIEDVPGVKPPTGTAEDLLQEYLDAVREEFSEGQEYESLKNILAEIEALVGRTTYKLLMTQ